MLNEQLARMTLYSHIDQPGLSWRTRGHREERFRLATGGRQTKKPAQFSKHRFMPVTMLLAELKFRFCSNRVFAPIASCDWSKREITSVPFVSVVNLILRGTEIISLLIRNTHDGAHDFIISSAAAKVASDGQPDLCRCGAGVRIQK